MSAHAPGTNLRLVGGNDPVAMSTWRSDQMARDAIARENHASARSSLDPGDPRWVLAARAYAQLQGAVMTPGRRDRVLRTAKLLGVNTFDANVIIAIVQDAARRGQPLGATHPLIEMVPRPQTAKRAERTQWAAAIIIAVFINLFLIWWLLGA